MSLLDVYSPQVHQQRDVGLTERETSGQRTRRREEHTGLLRRPFVGAEATGYVVYHSLIATWLFVAGLGVAELV